MRTNIKFTKNSPIPLSKITCFFFRAYSIITSSLCVLEHRRNTSCCKSKNEAYVRKNPGAVHQFYLTKITTPGNAVAAEP